MEKIYKYCKKVFAITCKQAYIIRGGTIPPDYNRRPTGKGRKKKR